MGFLGGLLGKKEPGVKVEKIQFSELTGWEAQQRLLLSGSLDEKSNDAANRALGIIGDARSGLDALGKAPFKRELQERAESMITSARDNYVAKVGKALEGLSEASDALRLSEELGKTLEEISAVDMKYGERANFGYPDELNALRRCFNRLVDASGELNALLGEKKKKLKVLKEIENALNRLNEINAEQDELAKRRVEAASGLRGAERALQEDVRGVDEIDNSKNMEMIRSMEYELTDLRAKRQELENFVLNVLGPLKRAFKKYAKAIEDGKATGMNVDKYADDPSGTYLRGDQGLPDLLASTIRAVQAGSLELDEGEGEKTVKKIRNISFSYLDKARSEHNVLVSRIRSLEVKINELSVEKEREKLQREIDSLHEKIAEASKSVERAEETLEERRLEAVDLRKSLELKISDYIGGKCELV